MRAAGQPADLVESFALPVPSLVICHLLGVPYADHEFFQEHSRILLAWPTRPSRSATRSRTTARLPRRLRGAARRPRRGPARRLAARVETGELTRRSCGLCRAAALRRARDHRQHDRPGHAGPAGTPRPAARAPGRPELIDGAVEELLRYLTIVRTGLPRVALEDIEVGGQLIRAGEGSGCCRRPTATPTCSPTATASTSTATPAGTSPSASACTSASASRWPAPNCASRCPS